MATGWELYDVQEDSPREPMTWQALNDKKIKELKKLGLNW